MPRDATKSLAWRLFEKGMLLHQQGDYENAAALLKKSITLHATAEARTWLGRAYSMQGRTAEAIEECKKAIAEDPALGDPYHDIGACLIDLGRAAEAVAWLEKAASSERYDHHHSAWFNLGRAYMQMELYGKARACLVNALEIEPDYGIAEEALEQLRRLVQ